MENGKCECWKGKGKMKIMEKLGTVENRKWKGRFMEFQDKFGVMIFVLASCVMLLFFYNYSKDIFVGISGEKGPAREVFLEDGAAVEQEFRGEGETLMGISIRFGVHTGGSGRVHVQLSENGEPLEGWNCMAGELEDGGYRGFPFHTVREMKKDAVYKLSITGESEKGNGASSSLAGESGKGLGVSVWLTEEPNGSIFANREPLGGYALCWQQTYMEVGLKNGVRLGAAILFLAVGLAVLYKVDEKKLMSGILAALGAVYFWMCPLGMAPDETNHFYRAYEVSCGGWASQHMGEDGVGGNYLPAALQDYHNPNAEIDTEDIAELHYGNTALYAPVSYLPQAVGIRIARMFTGNVVKIFYAGRLGGFLASMLLCLWAIYLMPFGKKILFLVMAFPMSMQEMASLAPDGFTIALSMAFLAYIFRIRCRKEAIGKKEMVLVGLMGIVIALCKIVYVVLLLLVFLLPREKFTGKKQAMLFQFGIPGAAFAMNLIWLKISAGYLIEFMPGVSSREQVKYVLGDLPNYCVVVMKTLWMWGVDWVQCMVGRLLGALNVEISGIVWMGLLVMFVYEVCNCRQMAWKAGRKDWMVFIFIFLSGSALICTSIYVQWTAVASDTIAGVQGRYFTPILPCLAMAAVCGFHLREQKQGEAKIYQVYGSYFYMLLLMLHGITVLDVIHHYI